MFNIVAVMQCTKLMFFLYIWLVFGNIYVKNICCYIDSYFLNDRKLRFINFSYSLFEKTYIKALIETQCSTCIISLFHLMLKYGLILYIFTSEYKVWNILITKKYIDREFDQPLDTLVSQIILKRKWCGAS